MPYSPPQHQPLIEPPSYDQSRGTAAERGYNAQWKKASKHYLAEHPICEIRGPDCTLAASLTDHRIPITQGGARLDPNNFRASCRNCHTAVTTNLKTTGVNELPAGANHVHPLTISNDILRHIIALYRLGFTAQSIGPIYSIPFGSIRSMKLDCDPLITGDLPPLTIEQAMTLRLRSLRNMIHNRKTDQINYAKRLASTVSAGERDMVEAKLWLAWTPRGDE
jgi:5-methylcytosine-specific restriction protein A